MLKQLNLILRSDLFIPSLLLITYVVFLIIIRRTIPTSEELINTFAALYQRFGYEIIFSAALLEALVLVNLFTPGQLAMALGVIFARTGQTELTLVVLTASAGAILGYTLDFLLGYFGFADVLKKLGYGNLLTQANKQLKKFGKRGLILGFIHANIASFLSLAAGTSGMRWVTFLSLALVATLFWATLWAILIYILGDIFLLIFRQYAFLLILLILGGMILLRVWKKEEDKK